MPTEEENAKNGLTSNGGDKYIADDHSEQYDRQIRLWGVEAQQRMSGSRVLFSGMTGVTAEGCKNLLLAGLSATLRDDGLVDVRDIGANFLLEEEDIGKNRAVACEKSAKELNRLVGVSSEIRPLDDLPDLFFQSFRVVVLSGASPSQQLRVANLCRKFGANFYTAETFGYDGFIFCDLGPKHTYRKEVGQNLSDPVDAVFPTLEEATAANWGSLKDRWGLPVTPFVVARVLELFHEKFGRRPLPSDAPAFAALVESSLATNTMPADYLGGPEGAAAICATASAEVSPVCAILGGILGQEVIKAISGKNEPACNCIAFSGMTGVCKIIHTPKQ